MTCSTRITEYEGVAIIYVAGELDLSACPEFESTALKAAESSGHRLIVDLLDVSYAEAGPIGVLIKIDRALASRGGALAVVCCDKHVRRLIETARIDRGITIFEDRDAAASFLKSASGSGRDT